MDLVNIIKEKGIDILRKDPYNFFIYQDDEYPQLHTINYDQIKTKDRGTDPVIRQARGIILDLKDPADPKIVCYPFDRFYNYGEGKADKLDLKTAKILEKADGSLIKFYFHPYKKEWVAASRNRADILSTSTLATCYQKVMSKQPPNFGQMDPSCTYMCELVGPTNQVVVKYDETRLIHLGSRSLQTLQEFEADIGLPKPFLYDLNSGTQNPGDSDNSSSTNAPNYTDEFESIKGLVKGFKGREREGVIVVDANFLRVKVKGPSYLMLHHSTGPGVPDELMCMRAVLLNDGDELKAGKEGLAGLIDYYNNGLKELLNMWHRNHAMLMKDHNKDNRQFAQAIYRLKGEGKVFLEPFHFALRSGTLQSPEEVEDQIREWYQDNQKTRDLIQLIEMNIPSEEHGEYLSKKKPTETVDMLGFRTVEPKNKQSKNKAKQQI